MKIAIVLATATLPVVLGVLAPANADPGRPIHRDPIPVCAVEDASSGPVPCVWIASILGNQEGHSFRVFKRVYQSGPHKGDHVFKIISANRAFELAGECDSDGPIYC